MKKWILLLLMVFSVSTALAAPETPEAFADWFVEQGFDGRDYYAWKAVFNALTDGIDRSREASMPVEHPVFVAILTGTKYHSDESCPSFGNADRVLTLDVEEAKERGFEACKRCTTDK